MKDPSVSMGCNMNHAGLLAGIYNIFVFINIYSYIL